MLGDQLGVERLGHPRVHAQQPAPGAQLGAVEQLGRLGAKVVAHTMSLAQRLRPADGDPEGALVLFHGRGTDENDLFPLLDELDPRAAAARRDGAGPLALPPGGWHWYVIRQVGFPDPDTSTRPTGSPETGLTTCSPSTASRPSRPSWAGSRRARSWPTRSGWAPPPRPAGVIGLSGFIPRVEGFELGEATGLPVAIGHGILRPDHPRRLRARRARPARRRRRRRDLPRVAEAHTIDPGYLSELRGWVADRVSANA